MIFSYSHQVGDIILLHKNQRVPADMVLLWTSEPNGSCFIRTDQLDGETDWKLRTAVPVTQNLVHNAGRPEALFDMQVRRHVFPFYAATSICID